MAQREFITSTSQVELRALAWQGIQAHTCYEQLARILHTRLSPRHAALLALPIMDNASAKSQNKEVDWYFNSPDDDNTNTYQPNLNPYPAPCPNPSPVKLLSLPPTSQAMLRQTFMELGQDIYNLAQSLKTNSDSNTVTAGNLLELAISFPSEEFLYAVGAQPVLVAWGFALANMDAQPELITRIRPAPLAAAAAGIANTGQSSAINAQAQQSEHLSLQSNIQEERRVTFSSIPWAILTFLLGALICALLLFWLLPKWGIVNFGGCTRAPIPLLNASTPESEPLPHSLGLNENNEELLRARQHEQVLREKLRQLEQELQNRMAKCPQPQQPKEPAPLLDLPPDLPPDLPEEVIPPLAGPTEEPETLPELEPEYVPPVPDIPLPELNAEPEPTTPENLEPKPELPPEPDFLEIPENAQELGFLEGCWNAKIGLKNRQTGQPVTVEYCFDQNGNGTVNITERDRSGKIIQKCTGSARAIVQGNDLQINDDGAQCPDGKIFGGNSVICRNNQQQAQCKGQSQSGEKWGPVPFSTNRP